MSGTRRSGDEPFRTRAQQLEKLPPCQAQCPNSGDVRGWLGIIAQHDKNGVALDEAYDEAWAKIAEVNPFPATTGRICPHPCEDRCSRSQKDGAVSINALERFLGDWAISRKLRLPVSELTRHAESIGVVGSGPASLSFAYQMARRGYDVTIYEKDEQPGGMLRHAIPEYRLPADILDAEIDRILDLRIHVNHHVDIGVDVSFEELRERHTLMFLGVGAQHGRDLGVPGEKGPGVVTGIDYLRQRKQHLKSHRGQRVLVIGGGNTAIDAARTARREGADVLLLYRRSEAEMPATGQEIEDARSEGVDFRFLVTPTEILREGEKLSGIRIQRMRLGEPDAQGRRRPLPIDGEMDVMEADVVIVAVSQEADWHGIESLHGEHRWLRTRDDGKLDDRLWAGGDDRGPGIASKAIAQGRLAAEAAHAELRGEPLPAVSPTRPVLRPGSIQLDYYATRKADGHPRRPESEWLSNPEVEIEQTLSYDEACTAAQRCMSCGLCFDCEQCFMYCNAGGFARIEQTSPGHYYALALDACEGCGKCIELCPCGYLEARGDH
jgi:NADPH-dependent glutamate synthase beta subunit-like oxidoreductase/NAD-dependent dihydropyrimidine dehydrogenase PreA subunit